MTPTPDEEPKPLVNPPNSTTRGLRHWALDRREPGPDLQVCRARFDWLTNPRTGKLMKRTVLETPDWVNVVALDKEQRLILVHQFRFGTAQVTTEIPGGMVDRGEFHGDAAKRELREEAGHTAERWTYLGCVQPNPAFQDNVCHHWLAEGASLTHPQELDSGEDIAVEAWTLEQVRKGIVDGSIRHALVLTALSRVFDLRPFEGRGLRS
jgi:8-oxo-dGTP pyrophosphatase MutT (NUDIX family)